MNFQAFADSVDYPCCVISVRKADGEIRLVAANAPYKEIMGPGFYDNMIYSELVPQDNKFEDFCYRAAFQKQKMHAYVQTSAWNSWTDQTLIPLRSDREDIGYCQFIFEFTQNGEAERMASVSVNTAETVIRACIKLMGASDFTTRIGDVLDIIMETSQARASCILTVDHEKKRIARVCERIVGDSRPVPNTDALTYDLVDTWEGMIGASNAVIIQNDRDLVSLGKANPAWEQSLRENLVRSLVLIPLRREAEVVGYMYVINFDVTKVVEVKELIELMSFFLGSEIYNHVLLEKLEELNQMDALTGVFNRRAMIQKMKLLSERRDKTPYGIINIDLNGLKFVNDHTGHDAGDRLLIQAGELLKKIFYQDDVFRTGGDEFVVISNEIDRQTFERKIQRLHADALKNGVNLAVGQYWSDGSDDVATAFYSADETMYEDKKAFYKAHPELRRV